MIEENKTDARGKNGIKYLAVAVLSITVIFIIIWLMLKFAPQNNSAQYVYRGFSFKKEGLFWFTQLQVGNQLIDMPFRYGPRDLEDITVPNLTRENILGKNKIYLTCESNMSSITILAEVEVARILGFKYGILNIPTEAALTDVTQNSSIPWVTCANATNATGVILFRTGNATSILIESGCVIVQGTDEQEIIRTADRLSYYLLYIMN